MVTISLTSEEASVLSQILASYLSDLRMEIADTDQLDYRETLKEREAFIKRLIDTLNAAG